MGKAGKRPSQGGGSKGVWVWDGKSYQKKGGGCLSIIVAVIAFVALLASLVL